MTRFTLEQVGTKLARFIDASGGEFTGIEAEVAVNKALNGFYDPYDRGTEGQTRRCLEKMARSRILVKVGRGFSGPGGKVNYGRPAWFYTPEAYAASEAAHKEEQRAARDELAWRQRIREDLAELGIDSGSGPGGVITLSPASWDKLLSKVSIRD
jgi:hypothetical protein